MTENLSLKRQKRIQEFKRRRKRKRIISASVAILLIILLITVFHTTPEEEFQEFADSQYEDELYVCMDKDLDISYSYGEGFSTAVAAGKTKDKQVKSFAEKKIKKLESEAGTKAAGEGEHALLSMWNVTTSSNGAECLIIYSAAYAGESYSKMQQMDNNIKAYYFDKETGSSIKPVQILEKGYESECAPLVQNTVAKEYKKKELAENWTSKINKLDCFALDDENLTFYMPIGIDSKILPVSIPVSRLNSTIRDTLLKRYVEKGDKMVAITFDDGPGGKSEAQILKTLQKHNAVATFFYLGRQISENPDNVKKAYDIGCEIGSHTWSHSNLSSLSTKQLKSEFSKTNKAIKNITGKNPTVCRPPYGSYSDKVLKVAKEYKMPVALWSVDTLDWSSKNKDKVFKQVKSTKNLNGRIILCHSIYGSTADALDMILPWLEKNGYKTVTVSELIRFQTGKDPEYGKVY